MSDIIESRAAATRQQRPVDVLRATLAGFCATLVGLGLARFAYTPLLPAVIDAHWLRAADASYLGAANLAGHLAGALVASPLVKGVSPRVVVWAMMLVATIALAAPSSWASGSASRRWARSHPCCCDRAWRRHGVDSRRSRSP